MSAESLREETILEQALTFGSKEARLAYLQGACGGDERLRARVASLIEAHEAAGGFLKSREGGTNGVAATVLLPITEKPGDRLGRYKLLQQIGEGGCGVVYMAEQEEPVRRRVALKVIKLGMDTKSVIARFEAERQALALMDHPNIAKVLDAGATETGRPYFVMELVRGVRITDYCDQNNLSTRERLDLYIQVCHAIQHAHQKGIIHRDIKPSNILVSLHDGVPVPVVIDFGIAKATEQRLTDKTLFTAFEQFIGTPAYMSPEQAEMSRLDIDTRSDIYSLGVLLYELLTGKTPFDSKELLAAGLDEMRRTIREQEPARPSTRLDTLPGEELTTTAKRRGTEAPKLIHQVRGDLDWIVMKCLEKDRRRRYETANMVAQDLERHLNSEPVVARPPSTAYRVQKFVQRNQLMVAAGSAVAAALVIGLGLSTWLFFREQHARRRAVTAEETQSQLRQEAEANAKKAQAEREQAEANAYAADMNLAQQALLADDLGKARSLLARYRPGSGREHLRGFDWRCLAAEVRSDYAATDSSSAQSLLRLALSPDGRTLAVGRLFGSIELWDPTSLKRTATLETNVGYGVGVAFAPTGRLLAASAPRGGIRLWQLDPPRVVGELAHTNCATRLTFSPDGRHLASYHMAGGVCVWDLQIRQTVRRYLGFLGGELGRPICFSPDGGHLALGDYSGQIRIVDWAADRVLADIPAHQQEITSLAYAPDGKLLASGSGYSPDDIRLWNPANGQPAGSLAGHRAWICALQFSGDGRRLFSGSGDQTIRIWDVPARGQILKLRGHLDEVYSLALDEGRANLITGSKDGTLARWEIDKVRPHALRLDLPGGAWRPDFATSGSSLAVLDQQGAVALWRPDAPQQLSTVATLGENNAALATAFGCGLLACATTEGPVRILSVPSANLVTNLGGHTGPVDGLRFSKKEDFLLAFSESGLVSVWDAKTWARRSFITATNGASSAAVSPDGRVPGDERWTGTVRGVGSAALSPDGRLLILGLEDGRLEWWDAVRGQRLAETPWHRQWARGVDFSPDGTTLATASMDGTLALWDTSTRRRTASWKADPLGLHAVSFSPDGARLATGLSGGYTARVWDLGTRRELLTLVAPGGIFVSVKFAPDGDALLCGDQDGHCYLWRAPPFAELDIAAKGKPTSD